MKSQPRAVATIRLGRTVSDLLVEQLALSEAELLERIAELEADNRWLREILHEAVTMLRANSAQFNRSRESLIRLRAEYRAMREATLRKTEAA